MAKKKTPKKKAKGKVGGQDKHGTRRYQKDMGGPSWDKDHETPPDVEDVMAIIERSPDDLELYRKYLVLFANDTTTKNLSMTEQMNLAEMNMLREKIVGWMVRIDKPDRMEELRECNKMLRAIWQITNKTMTEARERAPLGGTFEGISETLDEIEDAEYEVVESEEDE